MTFCLILFGVISSQAVYSHESGSTEVNRIEVTPYYDTIIFSDVADIINDFENMNPLETIISSASESEENIEDLLSEYQHYLEKAHKQRTNYLEKNKVKNRVPMIRHDRYTKSKPTGGLKYDDYIFSNGYFTQNKLPITPFNSPVDLFLPVNPKLRYLDKTDLTAPQPNHEEIMIEKRLIELPPITQKTKYDPIKSSCFCKNGQIPCDCKCRQCLVSLDTVPQSYVPHSKLFSGDGDNRGMLPTSEFATEERLRDGNENTLNVRIKVDIQLPKTQEVFGKLYKNKSREEIINSKETLNLPFPYFNFPIPMDLFGYKKSSKINGHDSAHKITIHKKKKSRLNNNGSKKHRNKKVIAFHNLNIQPQQSVKAQTYFEEKGQTYFNNTDYNEKTTDNSIQSLHNITQPDIVTPQPETSYSYTYGYTVNTTKEAGTIHNNETQTEESIFVMVNITKSSDNGTEDNRKLENSVETEYTKMELNVPTERLSSLRRKRDISNSTSNPSNSSVVTERPVPPPIAIAKKNDTVKPQVLAVKTNDTKKIDKALVADAELLFWPNNYRNTTVVSVKNITTIILERENEKAKLNMSKEAIRSNRTRALERAIFGDVNWDDVDTVAPVFLSFVGKYIRGVLTFCSQNICHSMKCAEKTCVHRICVPGERWNQKGHCAGSNDTDSIASLESIMDLPSNVAFEIVDILQDRMQGKLFGKVTLCISSKCISFVVCKKNFLKSKCSVKDLKIGHCPNIKKIKTV